MFEKNVDTKEILLTENCDWINRPSFHNSVAKSIDLITEELRLQIPSAHYDSVFVLQQAWNGNIYHFMLETLPKIIPWIEFLRDHSEIKIILEKSNLQRKLFAYLNLQAFESRLVNGTITADNVYVPRGTRCGLSQVSPTRILNDKLSQHFQLNSEKHVVLIKREKRKLPDKLTETILQSIRRLDIKVLIYQGSEDTKDIFSSARLIIGAHGAGLSNMIFAQPGTLIIEIHYESSVKPLNLAYMVSFISHIVKMCYFEWTAMTIGHKYVGLKLNGLESVQTINRNILEFLNI